MDFQTLKNAITANSVPQLNKSTGFNFNILGDLKEYKRKIVEHYCSEHNITICETDEHFILAANTPITEHVKFFSECGITVIDEGNAPLV